ncbi:MAG: L,D-transpeptidase family protein, partial [Planctomycetota bacterium]
AAEAARAQPLSSMLQAAAPLAAQVPEAPARVDVSSPAVETLVAELGKGGAADLGQAWIVVATGTPDQKQRVLAAMPQPGSDLGSLLAVLGPHNAFLHSAEGRELGKRAVAAAMALPDADAVPAGSRLLELMLRGRIQRADETVRAFVDDAYRQHRIRVDRWLCDPANVAGARSHTVAGGESLARIAARFRREKILVENGTLAILNRIHNENAIQAGQKIKVPVAPLRAVLEKRSFGLSVYVGDHLLRLYWVGHGENDRTPLAEFTVGVKQPRPDWTSPDGQVYAYGHPKNILGEYFIKFVHDTYVGFGAHGTPLPDTICTMSSMGCLRMQAPDIAEMFRLLPTGARVAVKATESLP